MLLSHRFSGNNTFFFTNHHQHFRFSHMCAPPGHHHSPRAATTLHIRLAHPSTMQPQSRTLPTSNSTCTHASIQTGSHLTPQLTLQPATHLPDIPTPVPWGCYVHTWKGCVGLCPSPLFGCCYMHPGCSTVVKCALSPAEQACPYFHSLSSL